MRVLDIKMKKIIYVVGIIFLVIVIILLIDNNYDEKIRVSLDKCVDGDTAWFVINNKRVKVRFLGVDTPEVNEYYGDVASAYTCKMLTSSKDIYIEYDIDRYDKYDRTLAWVYVDTNNLSELLVSKGYARVRYVYDDYKYIDELCDKEYDAYNNKFGIWDRDYYKYEDGYCYDR